MKIYKCNQCGAICADEPNTDEMELEMVFHDEKNDIHICENCSIDWEVDDFDELHMRGSRDINKIILNEIENRYYNDEKNIIINFEDWNLSIVDFFLWCDMVALPTCVNDWKHIIGTNQVYFDLALEV